MADVDWPLVATVAGGSVAVVLLVVLVARLFRRPAKASDKHARTKSAMAKPVAMATPTEVSPSPQSEAASLGAPEAPHLPVSPAAATVSAAVAAHSPAPAGAVALNSNPQFTEQAADGGPLPSDWMIWRNPAIKQLSAGGVSVRGSPAEGKVSGLYQRSGKGLPILEPGDYRLQLKVRLADGDLRAGVAIVTLVVEPADATPVATFTVRLGKDPDENGTAPGAGEVGSSYRYETAFKVEGQSLNVRLHLGASEQGELEFLEAAIVRA